jgi:LuxR family maltose regulon positive regulatory protein
VLTEIRMQQLSFSSEETLEFVLKTLGGEVSDLAIERLHERTEGWPAGLRLAALAAPEAGQAEELMDHIPSDSYATRDYLLHEVLSRQPPEIREQLLRTAYLDRFCAPLCDAIAGESNDQLRPGSGADFIHWINEAGMFCIGLDSQQRWFRYHHLFQSMLKEQAALVMSEADIRHIHLRASRWFEGRKLFEEAIGHLLTINEIDEVAELIIRNRDQITNNEQWHRLDGWLRQIPPQTIESRPELLLLKARWLRTAGSREESQDILAKAEKLLETVKVNQELADELHGTLASTKSFHFYAMSDGPGAIAMAQKALKLLPSESSAERGFAVIILTAAMQMTGNVDAARKLLYTTLSEASSESDTRHSRVTRILAALCFVQWMDADLNGLIRSAQECAAVSASARLAEALTVARSFEAAVHYHRNELDRVDECLAGVLASRAIVTAEFHVQCLVVASLAHQVRGDSVTAAQLASELHQIALKTQNTFLLGLAEAFFAELAFRQGRMAEAVKWAEHFDPEPLTPIYTFYSSAMTLAKVLVLVNTKLSRQRAGLFLDRLIEYLARTHNFRFLAEALALRAILLDEIGQTEAAERDLAEAVRLALPGRFIRLFVDLGSRIISLLNRIELDDEALRYAGEILAAFEQPSKELGFKVAAMPAGLEKVGVESLSNREQQIIALLADRLSNKEIADRLHISMVTVKRHAANIYQKLGVHGRRQAVAKAAGLGILKHSD